MKKITLLTFIVFFTQIIIAQNMQDIKDHFASVGSSELLILGTFHFKDAGLDDYKPQHNIDILSKEKQKELQEVITAIKKFGPTKIAIEAKETSQKHIDSLYNEYLKGQFNLPANEIYQVGFRAAKMLGHKKVYAVDARSRGYEDNLTDKEHQEKQQYYAQKAGEEMVTREMQINQKYLELYEKIDALKTTKSLLDYFLLLNDTNFNNVGHGHYLMGNFKMGEGTDYYGPDQAMWWYNRNIRIFHNLLKIHEPKKEDKVFLLIGAGHTPILRFLAEASVDFDLKEFKDYTKNN